MAAPFRRDCLQLRLDAAEAESHLDGKWLLRTSDSTLSPEELAAAYKQLLQVERTSATSSTGCTWSPWPPPTVSPTTPASTTGHKTILAAPALRVPGFELM